MENELTPQAAPQPSAQPVKNEKNPEKKKGDEEFSVVWHIKVLMVIYLILGALYLVLKFTLR